MRDMEQQEAKQVPYGVADFSKMIEQNLYYVDKTMFIPEVENQADCLFFVRPRRFGKSLFLSMLHSYYDCKQRDKFESLFGNLWIGSHPTESRGRYQVLYLDFSQVGGSIDKLEDKFNSYFGIELDCFISYYAEAYSQEVVGKVEETSDAFSKLLIIVSEARASNYPLYLLIDEYDSYVNKVFYEDIEHVHNAIISIDSFYCNLFKLFKGNFERMFITGVTPITFDDVTSGFNIGWHISTNEKLNLMLGFTAEDVREMFAYYQKVGRILADRNIDTIINKIKPWYYNYCFSERLLYAQDKSFNPVMVFYFLLNYMDYGQAPEQMIDPNTKTDYGKMKKLLQFDKLDGERRGIIHKIAEEGQIVTQLYESFSAYQIPKAEIFPSLLFYYGMLTIKGTRGSKLVLGIPNNNVRKQYYGYLEEEYQAKSYVNLNKLTDYYYDMAYDGKWNEGLRFMAEAYAKVSSVRDSIEGERNLQGFFMAYLNLNDYYITAPELELNHGYCDFFLLPDLTHYPTKHSYIIELKMLSAKDFATKAESQWQEAVEQINRYATAPRVEVLRQGTQLHKIIMQFEGWELRRMEEV